ncbi:hypothetical protein GLAREA_05066 [Glarea lozoyensis ATCC 20868]|nr:uncharacterized protein GLAREA_05066 [Glarea lozoyensis ATCC 20868]EPE35729.1 hypothetical protein GLAREA_05066 [Glarea lozoyensis ATCC 20868]
MSLPIAGNKKVMSTLQVLLTLSENGITDFKFVDVRLGKETAIDEHRSPQEESQMQKNGSFKLR